MCKTNVVHFLGHPVRNAQTAASGARSAGNNGTSEADRPVPLLRVLVVKLHFFLQKGFVNRK